MLELTPLFMLTFPPVISTILIPLPCSTSLMTSLFTTWPPWPPSLHPNGPLIQVTLTRFLCQLTLSTHLLPWYKPASNRHSYHMGDPFVHGYSHMGYTFEGLIGRTSINEVGERMHEACFHRVQVLPQKDDIFTWLIQLRRHTPNHIPACRKVLRRMTRVFPHCFTSVCK